MGVVEKSDNMKKRKWDGYSWVYQSNSGRDFWVSESCSEYWSVSTLVIVIL